MFGLVTPAGRALSSGRKQSVATSLGIDTHAKAATASVALVSSGTIKQIILLIGAAKASSTTPPTVSGISGGGLTWSQRFRKTYTFYSGSEGVCLEEWCANCPPGSFNDTITATLTGADATSLIAFGVTGTPSVSPFDPNASLPKTAAAASPGTTVTWSTDNADDLALAFGLVAGGGTVGTIPTGFTSIDTVLANAYGAAHGIDMFAAKMSLSAVQSNTTTTWSNSNRTILGVDVLTGG